MSSTDDFTYRETLSLADRKLILFLIVALIDERQRLTTTYQAVLAKWSATEGHWAHGKDLSTMGKACAKYLGKSAEKRPSWTKILDTVQAALPPEEAAETLAVAAGLFSQAKKITRPDGYDGPICRPPWAAPDVEHVTVDVIRSYRDTSRTAPHTTACQAPAITDDPASGDTTSIPAQLAAEIATLRELLDVTIRAFRVRDHEWHEAEVAAQNHWSTRKALTQRARAATTEVDRLNQDNDDLRQRLGAVTDECLRLLSVMHPDASTGTLHELLDSSVEAASGRLTGRQAT
ncbi:MAG TPA: hypothetical protein VHV49_17405 [Pseudonocardiaceae bacterium]|nr:hypothetical protein [Pseudonocardiaceae bacterium]